MTDTVQQAPQENGTDLTINDLNALKVIIDIASSRGAFKPNEMVAVGQTYTKLTTFLDAVAKQQPAQTPAQQPTSDAVAQTVAGV
jgi:translation initiation factor IF-2